jgi:tRNA (cmo5U34)-methyltransferase
VVDPVISQAFGREQAQHYDERWARTAPLRDALDFLTRTILQTLPRAARILCVGAGTGVELLKLAEAFPEWCFVALDPSGPMLDVCRKKVEAAGFAARCTFHEGYLETAPAGPFDAATAILVSQFLTDRAQRRAFFAAIATRLRPGGVLVSADLAAESMDAPEFDAALAVWGRTQGLAHPEGTQGIRAGWRKSVGVLAPGEVEKLIEAGGFERPVRFYQALFIHGWFALRST